MSTNRRQFIQQLAMAATGPLGLLNATAFANTSDNASSPAQRRLVLVELAGANDGLNTLVPYRDSITAFVSSAATKLTQFVG